MNDFQNQGAPTQTGLGRPVVETASATTDPDNARSGPGAYVAFALAAALVALFVFGLSSCVAALGDFVASDIGRSERVNADYLPWEDEEPPILSLDEGEPLSRT